jgi:hypothetical protein
MTDVFTFRNQISVMLPLMMKTFLLLLLIALPVCAQDTNTSSTAQQTPPATTTPATTYVFPTKSERFKRYVNGMVGPYSLLTSGVAAGINQWRDNPEEWEQGMSGYGKRYASSFGVNAIHQTVTYGLDSALHLDTGFRKSQHKDFGGRFQDALIQNVTSRTRSGKRVIGVPRIAGIYTSNIIASETWYPDRYSYKDGMRNASYSLLSGFGMNLLREFVLRF